MKTRIHLGVITMCVVLSGTQLLLSQTATHPAGSGTAGDPFRIDSLPNLYWITQNSNTWDSSFVQTAAIDASSDSTWNAGAGFTPIGLSSYFTGTYNGNGHTITGLFISRGSGSDAGMFGSTNGATLKNIKLVNVRVKVTGGGGYVGGLVAENYSSSIDSCTVSGSVSSSGNEVGGLVGRNVNNSGPSTVTNSSSSAIVTGGSNAGVGGLVGDNNSCTITNCYSTGSVLDSLSGADLGGLVGISESGSSVSNSYSTATVTGTGVSQEVGGLVGYLSVSSVVSCYVSGTVHGKDQSVGGLVGFATGNTSPAQATVTGCHSTATVVGDSNYVGGLIGNVNTEVTITNSYSGGTVTGTNQYAGGLVGYTNQMTTIRSCYSTAAVTGGSYVGGLVGYGNGVNTGSSIIDSSYATGSVRGSGYVAGFIGYVTQSAISNSHGSGNVRSTGSYSGGFAGDITGVSTVTDCYAVGSDSGSTYAGGFAGLFDDFSSITGSYSIGKVQGSSEVGGFVGYAFNSANITNCYSRDTVIASGSNVGGLVGGDGGTGVDKCYSSGSVTGSSLVGGLVGSNIGSSTNSFWDTQTSGQSSSSSGDMGQTTSQMQTQSTFTNAGWDFGNTWVIDAGINNGYPGFAWQAEYPASAPTASTNAASNTGYSYATLNGTVNPYKGTTTVKFIYGTVSGNYPDSVTASQSPVTGWAGKTASASVSGLTASTTYYFRVIVTSLYGSNEGSEVSFATTATPSAPTASTASVSGIASTTAISHGTANANGDSTTVRFLYGGTSGVYTDSVLAAQSPLTGYSDTSVSANLSGLTPGQTYYVRVSAWNSLGYVRGSEVSFTTTVATETAPSGSGTSGDPHMIASLANLNWLQDAANDTAWGDFYKQTANIEASATSSWNAGAGFSPIGTSTNKFSGSYDGQGYSIDSLYISRSGSDYQGLFGYTSSSAVIDSLGVTNANVSGNDFVGALVGLNSSGASIIDCYTTGKVFATKGDCGGLIGENAGSVAESFSTCTVTGGNNYSMGGLIGYTPSGSGTISNCYTTGEVSVSCGGAGGLVGNHSGGSIVNCYSVSKVSAPSAYGGLIGGNYTADAVTNSFFDTDSTSSSAAGNGETSSSLKTLSTFTNAGWDFVRETTNGTNDYWDMDTTNKVTNSGYPFPSWQNGGAVALPVEMASFTVTSSRLSASLQWKTVTEVNTNGFEIQRSSINLSTSNPQWFPVAFVKGHGMSTAPISYSYADRGLSAGEYSYRLKQIDNNGSTQYSKTVNIEVGNAPRTFTLSQNYPNPFNPTTTIEFTLEKDGRVSLKVYDILGREVATLLDENRQAGVYQQVFFNGSRYSSGVYFAVLRSGEKQMVKKMLMLK